MTSKLTINVTGFRRVRRGSLIGFVNVHLPEVRLTIRDIAVHQTASGAHWTAMPAKPLLDLDGTPKRTSDGRIQYALILGFDDRAVSTAFSARVIASLLEFDPTVFDKKSAA